MATATELAKELYEVRGKIADLKRQESELIDTLAAEMSEKTLEVPGVGVFERHSKSTRKTWNHQGLQSALLRKLRNGEVPKLVTADGEIIDEDDTERAFRVLTECARPEWRLKPLRELDIDPDEYSEVTYTGGYSIEFHGDLS